LEQNDFPCVAGWPASHPLCNFSQVSYPVKTFPANKFIDCGSG